MKRIVIIALLVLALSGCLVITKSTPEFKAYHTAKTATRIAVRFKIIPLEKLKAAEPHLEAAHAALGASSEAELDVAIGKYLAQYVDAIENAADRAMVRDVIEMALGQIALKDPGVLESRDVAIVRRAIGGILDGIAVAEEGDDGGR